MTSTELPSSRAGDRKVRERFERIARAMRENRMVRASGASSSRGANQQFKNSAYKLISHYVEHDYHHTFAWVLSKLGRIPKTSIQPSENPFFWGLLAICGEETIFSINQLRRIADGMLQAHAAGVAEDRVIEFLERIPANRNKERYSGLPVGHPSRRGMSRARE